MAEGYLYDRGDELIERKDLSESLVPEVDPDTDEGKVLTVDSEGKTGWETPESGLPAITPTTDQGKVLTVNSEDEAEWSEIEGLKVMRLTFPSVASVTDNTQITIPFPSGISRAEIVSHIEAGGVFAINPTNGSEGDNVCGIIVKPVIYNNTIYIPGLFVIANNTKNVGGAVFNQLVFNEDHLYCTSSGSNFKCKVRIVTSVLSVDGTTVYPST